MHKSAVSLTLVCQNWQDGQCWNCGLDDKRSRFKNVLRTKYAGKCCNYADHNKWGNDKFTNERDCCVAINSNARESCLLQNDANVNQRKWRYQIA